MLKLRKMNWKDYIRSNNPVAAALLSKMGYKESETDPGKLKWSLIQPNLSSLMVSLALTSN